MSNPLGIVAARSSVAAIDGPSSVAGPIDYKSSPVAVRWD